MLFHLTDVQNVDSILADGIKPNEEGAIYTITDLIVANNVAATQIFCRHYAVFLIHPDYETEADLVGDSVAELTSGRHAIIVTDDPIPPEQVLHLGNYEARDFTEWDHFVEWMVAGNRMTLDGLREQKAELKRLYEEQNK